MTDNESFDKGFKEGYVLGEKRIIARTVDFLRESGAPQEEVARICLGVGFTRAEIMYALELTEEQLWSLVPKTRRERNEDFYRKLIEMGTSKGKDKE